MTDTFDWAGLAHEAASIRYTHGDPAAAAYLRTRIEAAFVPVDRYEELRKSDAFLGGFSADCLKDMTARAEAAEAENVRLREAAKRTKNAADAILAPLCAEVGRWLIEGKDEPDMIKVAHDYGVVIPVRAFADLYDATDCIGEPA